MAEDSAVAVPDPRPVHPARPSASGQGRATLRDVAVRAGVSTSTASRALSGKGYVSSEAGARISAAAQRLGYVHDASAQALRLDVATSVGVVLRDMRSAHDASIAAGVESALTPRKHTVMIGSHRGSSEQAAGIVEADLARRVGGLVLMPAPGELPSLLERAGVPVALLVDQPRDTPWDLVVLDERAAARTATEHLLQRGHRRILLVTGSSDPQMAAHHVDGHRDALAAAGLLLDDELILASRRDDPRLEDGDPRPAISDLLDGVDVTAIIACTMRTSEATWQVLADRGPVGEGGLALICLRHATWMQMVRPSLTRISADPFEVGRLAAGLLSRRLRTPDAPQATEVAPLHLSTGDSVSRL